MVITFVIRLLFLFLGIPKKVLFFSVSFLLATVDRKNFYARVYRGEAEFLLFFGEMKFRVKTCRLGRNKNNQSQ